MQQAMDELFGPDSGFKNETIGMSQKKKKKTVISRLSSRHH